MSREKELRKYLAKFPKKLLVSKEQAIKEAASGFPGQLTVWKLWEEYEALRAGKRRKDA
jgi:hypothetical protein